MRRRLIVIAAFFFALCATATVAAESLEYQEPASDPWRLYFFLGDYHAETTDNQLQSPGSEFALGIGGLFDYSDYFSWGFDAIIISRDYDTPDTVTGGPFTVVSDDLTLSTLGLNLTARLSYSAGIVNFYAGAGGGLYFTTLRITASTLGFPGTYEDTDTELGFFYNYGVLFTLTDKHQLGVEYRNLSLSSDFPPVTTQSIDIGGDFLLLSYSVAF